MSQNHRPAAPAIDPTKKSSLFEVPSTCSFRILTRSPDDVPYRQGGDDLLLFAAVAIAAERSCRGWHLRRRV
jgi:hypothetical protein